MTLRLDKFGRLLIPLGVRKQLGLESGMELALEVSEEMIMLTPRRAAGKLVRERGVLVWDGPNFDEPEMLMRDRQERDMKVFGSE